MCGFAGFINLDGREASLEALRKMAEVQSHRGPDDHGVRLFSLSSGGSTEPGPDRAPEGRFDAGVAFNRLSILDLSPNGHQPMCNEDKSVFIVFNGEIYNAFDYVPSLVQDGFSFRSRSDTEVILRLYERYGLHGTLDRLNGMFAIMIADLRKKEVWLVRDHLGIKPLYWAIQGKTFLFASEVKSLLAHPDFNPALEEGHLAEYLLFRYCAGERHLLKDVQHLRPGHLLQLKDGKPQVKRFFEISDGPAQEEISFSQAFEKTQELVRLSVKSQLISDVKVGCQLSGGIDSSLITHSARQQFNADMDAFSIVFRDPRFSEEPWITRAAIEARVDSHRFIFEEATFAETFSRATWHMDQPLSHPNALGIYQLAKKSRPLATVLLSGEGADELFGGYTRYFYGAVRPKLKRWLPFLRALPGLGPKFQKVLGTPADDPIAFFVLTSAFQTPSQIHALCPDIRLESVLEQRRQLFNEGRGDYLGNCLKYDMQSYMADLLIRQDKMTMAHSMENRVPFLDRPLVEHVRNLPRHFLVGGNLWSKRVRMGNTKIILKKLAATTFGDEFVYRVKSGFAFPLVEFFRYPVFRSYVKDALFPSMRRRGIWDASKAETWWDRIIEGQDAHAEAFWTYLAFEAWALQFLDKNNHPGA